MTKNFINHNKIGLNKMEKQNIQFIDFNSILDVSNELKFKQLLQKVICKHSLLIDNLSNNIEVNLRLKYSQEVNVKSYAAFSIEESTSTLQTIIIYPSTYNLFLRQNDNSIHEIEKILLHEIIHLLDFYVLKENLKEFNLKQKIININIIDKSAQWALLHLLATIRNEGLAILGEKLFLGKTNFKTNEEAFKLLEKDLNLAIGLCYNSKVHKRINVIELKIIIQKIQNNCYHYAESIFFYFLKNQLKIDPQIELSQIAKHSSFEEKQNILIKSLEFDVSEWIKEFLKLEFTNENLIQINHYKLNLLFNLDENNQIKEDINHIQILKHAYLNEKDIFLEKIKHIVEIKLTIEEIKSNLLNINEDLRVNDIENDIYKLAHQLIKKRAIDNFEIIDWSLSYLFNSNDHIHDDIGFIGLQDDWMILEGALILIS